MSAVRSRAVGDRNGIVLFTPGWAECGRWGLQRVSISDSLLMILLQVSFAVCCERTWMPVGSLGHVDRVCLVFPGAHPRARGCKEKLGRSAAHWDVVLGTELVAWGRRVPRVDQNPGTASAQGCRASESGREEARSRCFRAHRRGGAVFEPFDWDRGGPRSPKSTAGSPDRDLGG